MEGSAPPIEPCGVKPKRSQTGSRQRKVHAVKAQGQYADYDSNSSQYQVKLTRRRHETAPAFLPTGDVVCPRSPASRTCGHP
jgi:hypothetical protein